MIPVRCEQGKVRGLIDPEHQTFVLRRHRSKHWLLAYSGWGLNAKVWETVKKREDVRFVEVYEPDTGVRYLTSKTRLLAEEKDEDWEEIEFADRQVVLKEMWFDREEPDQKTLWEV